ncbi:MAG: bifunctional adenosylcobinamide kinase/adenosylcobinamide-phosphate guanylyltransferase [Lachnospiraceae bacterium]|nr:bifunctional adenosylcobinamide kinase/adenosylcobinamide-phosphate guanylyltransferase [Lachnospiraceae bacterium]
MIVVTGGAFQGKSTFIDNTLLKDRTDPLKVSGRTATFEDLTRADVAEDLQEWVRGLIVSCPTEERGTFIPRLMALADRLIAANPALIAEIPEMGCGVVPIDADERLQREAVGRLACRLAAESEAVYRLVMGVPRKIK